MAKGGAEPGPRSVIVRTLTPIGWTLLAISAVAALFMLVHASTERVTSPEAGRGLGVYAALLVMAIIALMGWLFSIAARKQSAAGLITMTLLLAYPITLLIARPLVLGYRTWKSEREQGRVGEFQDAALRQTANAIKANDTLVRPNARSERVRRSRQSANSCENGGYRLQPDGLPALVHFIGAQQWELALYLIDKGANLHLKNADGLSRQSLFERMEGWRVWCAFRRLGQRADRDCEATSGERIAVKRVAAPVVVA